MPPDNTTLSRTTSASPGVHGVGNRVGSLSRADLQYIEKEVGRGLDGRLLPLDSLLRLYGQQVRLYEEAASQTGPQSGAALFIRAIAERLADLIREAKSPRGQAVEKLKRLLGEAKAAPGPVQLERFSEAVGEALAAERDSQLRGDPDAGGDDVMKLILDVNDFVLERKGEEAKKLFAEARRPGNSVTEDQIGNIVRTLLGLERQKQLLGGSEEGGSSMALVGEALEIVADRREKVLKTLIEQAKRPGNKVTDEQLSKAVADVLGGERQKQLLGASDGGAATMSVVAQAVEVARQRHKAAIRSLVDKAQRPGQSVSKAEIEQAVRTVLGDERQRQLLGGGADDDPELSSLLEQAGKLYGELDGKDRAGGSVRIEITVGEIKVLHRSPYQ